MAWRNQTKPLSSLITALHQVTTRHTTTTPPHRHIEKIKPTSNALNATQVCWKIKFHLAAIATSCLAWPFLARRCRCFHCRRAESKCSSRRKSCCHQSGWKWLWGSPGLLSALGSSFCVVREEKRAGESWAGMLREASQSSPATGW